MRQTLLRKAPDVRRKALLATVFFVPLLFMRNLYDAINLPKLWVVMVVVALIGSLRVVELLQGSSRAPLRLLAVPAAALLAPLLIGWIFSPYRMWALMGDASRYTGLIPYAVLIAFGVLVADAFRGDVRPVAWALSASAAVAGAYAIVQAVGLDPLEWTYKGVTSNLVTSTLGNPNFAGGFFSIVLPVAVALVGLESDRRPLAGICAAFVVLGWVITRSETAWGAGVAGMLVVGGGFLMSRLSWARVVGFGAAGLIAATGVGLVALSMLPNDPGVTPRNLERRGEWWQASLGAFSDSPLVGRGPNAFAIEHTRHRTVADVEHAGFDVTDDAHSLPLSLATAAGIFGLAGFVVLAGWIVLQTWRAAEIDLLALAFGGAACAYLVQSLLSIDTVALRLAGWTALAGLAGGCMERAPVGSAAKRSKKRKQAEASEPLRALPAVAPIIVAALAAVWWSTNLVIADASVATAQRWLSDGEGQEAHDSYQAALDFRTNDTYVRLYGSAMTPVAVGLMENDAEDVGRELFDEIRREFERVEEIPIAASALAFARALEAWADVDERAESAALDRYERASALDPKNYLLLHEAAVAATSFDELEAAEDLLLRGLDIADTPQLWGQLALVQAKDGRTEEATVALENALELDPDDEAALEARRLIDR